MDQDQDIPIAAFEAVVVLLGVLQADDFHPLYLDSHVEKVRRMWT